MANKPLYITDTILRDAHQSQAATRMRLEDMLPALERLDKIGYFGKCLWKFGYKYEMSVCGKPRMKSDMSCVPAHALNHYTPRM